MSLDSTKQGYVLLKAFNNAGDVGIDGEQLANCMADICAEIYGEKTYVNVPVPLNTLIDNAYRDDEITAADKGGWKITEKGLRTYTFLKTRFFH